MSNLGAWYRGKHCNIFPGTKKLERDNALEKYILHGWLPKKPFITKQHRIVAFGSCFAEHLSKYLSQKGYRTIDSDYHSGGKLQNRDKIPVVAMAAAIANSFALRQQFEWAFEDKRFDHLWHNENGVAQGYGPQAHAATKKLFKSTDVFILTLGLSEVWCNKKTNEVYLRAIPKEEFNENVHSFRVSTCAENIANLEKIYQLIRKHRPKATIIMTLSPIPLRATFRPVSCITANSASKSILRAAIDEVYRMHKRDDNFFYWPSYEIVKEYLKQPYEADNRHVTPATVSKIMRLFSQHYLV